MDNPDPSEFEPLPEIKFNFDNLLKSVDVTADVEPSSLDPSLLEAALRPGETVEETKTGHLASAPPRGDIMMSFDLTGSMGGAISQAKANAINIISGVRTLIPDSNFGVMSHMDYNGSYSYCGYSGSYGGGPDYPYLLGLSLTSNATDVGNAVNGLSLGWGNDGYEDYTRILYESFADESIGWRDGSKKILLAWLDNYPHDCDLFTGVDPGRDAIAGTEDDLDFDNVLLNVQDNNITPIVITSTSWNLSFWSENMQSIGGDAYVLGADIVDQIVNIITTEFATLDEVTLEVCDPEYAGWFSCSPESIGPLDVTDGADVEFAVSINPPMGTAPGVYEFDICMFGDGAEYARQHVVITIIQEIPLDIHPAGCPNPLNSKQPVLLPAALLGTADFDVTEVDPATITLEGVPPIRWNLEDVGTPYEFFMHIPMDAYACNELEGDGIQDLTLKFNNLEVAAALIAKYGPLERNQVLILTLSGEFTNGLPFVGEDVMIVVR